MTFISLITIVSILDAKWVLGLQKPSRCLPYKNPSTFAFHLCPRNEAISVSLDVLLGCLKQLQTVPEGSDDGGNTKVEFRVC